jgi:hypothetical protein
MPCGAVLMLEDLLPSKDDRRVISFCESICPGVRPFYVSVRAESASVMLQCFPNVETKVNASGGLIIYGWNITQVPKIHVEAQFHAIWQSPEGEFVDITPDDAGLSRILFLRDDTRKYSGSKVSHQRFALGDKKLVERYWFLADQARGILEDLILAGFAAGHPVYRQRLGALQSEILALKQQLQNVK